MALTARQRAGVQGSASAEWYTPPDLLAEIAVFLGPDYEDPCPPLATQERLENGLAFVWRGVVFCNPPYGRGIGRWIRKATLDPVRECVLLVPARTDAGWFQPLFDHTICFI